MQTDMHYYGTYAMARAAGLKIEDARTIAFSAQFVDDSTKNDSEIHADGGILHGIASAHHSAEATVNYVKTLFRRILPSPVYGKIWGVGFLEQRLVWIPFHFLPGNEGDSFSERLLCRMNSRIAREMIDHHMQKALDSEYGLQLVGIAAHVYADTFSHYGFSGVSSTRNIVDGESFKFIGEYKPEVLAYIRGKFSDFMKKYSSEFISTNWRKLASGGAELASGALGHGTVGTYPDRPYLHWSVRFETGGGVSERNNPETFLEGCEQLHKRFSDHAEKRYPGGYEAVSFNKIREEVAGILGVQGNMSERIEAWKTAIRTKRLYAYASDQEPEDYNYEHWENQKKGFHELERSADGIELPVYKFHQAAAYHRYYLLKDLLPRYGLVVI